MARNPIHRIGDPPQRDYVRVPNDLARNGVINLGADAYVVLLLLLSHASGWETSAVAIGQQLGWGKNQRRARVALAKLADEHRLVIREHRKDAGGVVRREYVLYGDARRFTDEEVAKWSVPLLVAARGVNQNG